MSSRLDVRLGVVVPQIVHRPDGVASLGAATDAIDLADAYGVCRGGPLDASQRFTLEVGLGERADGSWAASTMADCEPRQNGKNDTLAARELAGLLLFDEQLLIHTAHEFKTANESFLRMVAVWENHDDLRRKVARIRWANGEQGIELSSGQRLKYFSRTGGSLRGFAEADFVAFDEAQHAQPEHIAASAPAQLVSPNKQAWFTGSGGLAGSAVWWQMRRRALAGGGGRFGYVEHTAERVQLVDGRVVVQRPDALDRDAWALANPAYGRRITDEGLQDLYDLLGPDLFARECLCFWDAEAGRDVGVFAPEVWRAVQVPDAEPSGAMCIGVAQVVDRSLVSVAVAGGGVVALVEPRPSVEGLAAKVVELAALFDAKVVIDPSGPAGWLVGKLPASVSVLECSGQKMTQACGALFSAVHDRQVTVRRHPLLDAAVNGGSTKPKGDAWVWARRDAQVDVSPLEAVTLALWGAGQVKPRLVFAY